MSADQNTAGFLAWRRYAAVQLAGASEWSAAQGSALLTAAPGGHARDSVSTRTQHTARVGLDTMCGFGGGRGAHQHEAHTAHSGDTCSAMSLACPVSFATDRRMLIYSVLGWTHATRVLVERTPSDMCFPG